VVVASGQGGGVSRSAPDSGSIARWLAAQLWTGGPVLANDIEPNGSARGGLAQIEVRPDNIAEDPGRTPPSISSTRLVLVHLPGAATS
jgi:hypothetical protein